MMQRHSPRHRGPPAGAKAVSLTAPYPVQSLAAGIAILLLTLATIALLSLLH